MMINKRLIGLMSESKKFIALNVIVQWISLLANVVIMIVLTSILTEMVSNQNAASDGAHGNGILFGFLNIGGGMALCVCATAILMRFVCTMLSSKMSFLSSASVKKILREKIYEKLLRLGSSYKEGVKTSEVVQVAVEGVDQLETYFGSYLPQFFYAMLAPLTLFAILCFVNVPSAVVLLVCVPLIPVAIAAVQTWAKKLLSKYWGQYTALGDTFLENLQGLTTLKIYQADEFKNEEMNNEAEKFRVITMKVLTMQLNSITIMDFIACGGAAVGIIMAITQFKSGNVNLSGALLIMFLSADFFIPMRQLGSFFHVAMNGMASSDNIFALLDLPENEIKTENCHGGDIAIENLKFSYDGDREILQGLNINLKKDSFTSIVGESGSGKSTIAAVLTERNKNYFGSVKIGEVELSEISEKSLMKNITYINHQSYIFKGTVRENLLMGKSDATDEELWKVLERVKLADFLRCENGLETKLQENGSNFSGGQRQRLSLARALLHDSQVYIFDEATSNIDVESENDIMAEIHDLAKTKQVILISHRLMNVKSSDKIYVLENGEIAESGKHEELLKNGGVYWKLWNGQQKLEEFVR